MSKKQPEKRYYVVRWKPDKTTYTSYSENEFVLKKNAARFYKIIKHFYPDGMVKVLYKVEEFITEEQLFWDGKYKSKLKIEDENYDFENIDTSGHIENYVNEDEPETFKTIVIDPEEKIGLVSREYNSNKVIDLE